MQFTGKNLEILYLALGDALENVHTERATTLDYRHETADAEAEELDLRAKQYRKLRMQVKAAYERTL